MNFLTGRLRLILAGGLTLLCIGLVMYGYSIAYNNGAESVQAKWDKAELIRVEQTNKAILESVQHAKDLQTSADKQRNKTNAQITDLTNTLSAVVDSLSHRPDRPSDTTLPNNPGSESKGSCTGADLYKADAEFLIREAARAEEIILRLDQCQQQYNLIKKQFNK